MTYLRNTWYAAAWGTEVSSERPIARTLLDEPLVFFRDAAGNPHGLADKCPHRFAPLSKGCLVGSEIQCPYHGLRFGVDGRCSHNPHGPIAAAARVQTYPLLERHGVIWIWMGDSSRADPESLADFRVIADADNFAIVRGTIKIADAASVASSSRCMRSTPIVCKSAPNASGIAASNSSSLAPSVSDAVSAGWTLSA